jgi:hypothetical protein
VHSNPLLPVLASFDSAYPWPTELDATGVEMLYVATSRLADRARELATTIRSDDTPPIDQLVLLWSARAGQHAAKVLRAAKVDLTGQVGGALWLAVSASLMVQEGEFHAGLAPVRGTCHGITGLNRALAIAEWIGAYRESTPVTAVYAAQVFADYLPPNWRWEHRPTEQPGGDNEPLTEFTLTRSAQDHRSYERITVTGRGDAPVETIHSHIGRTTSGTHPNWAQLCIYLADTYGRFYEPPPHGASPA